MRRQLWIKGILDGSSRVFSSLLFDLDNGRRGGRRRGQAGVGDLEGGEDVEGHWLLGNRKGR